MPPDAWDHLRVHEDVTDRLAGATRTGLVVPVPAAERAVGRHRRRLDPAAAGGVPAHVTVLYPFVPPERITQGTIDQVRAALAGARAFACTFARVAWFGETVVWLAPEPDEPFRVLTDAVWRRFPDHPPYENAYGDPDPHLTVGTAPWADLAGMRRAAAEVRAELPVHAWLDEVRLMAGAKTPDSWHTVAAFSLTTP